MKNDKSVETEANPFVQNFKRMRDAVNLACGRDPLLNRTVLAFYLKEYLYALDVLSCTPAESRDRADAVTVNHFFPLIIK